jgi:hypothetical protein
LEEEDSGDQDEDDRYENEPLCRRHEFVAAKGADTDVEIHVLLTGGAGLHRGQFIPAGLRMSMSAVWRGVGVGKKKAAPQSIAGPPAVCMGLAEGAKALCESKHR